jgi:hypothetical protein
LDEHRRAALQSFERGDPLAAREHAQAILLEVPKSPTGLALLADSCEALWLDDELLSALHSLCESAPWRGELWVRLAETLIRVGAPTGDAAKALENVLGPDMDRAVQRRALLILADLDIRAGDAWRASHWLEMLRFHADDPDVVLRRLEVALLVGDRVDLVSLIERIGKPATLDGRAALALGRARWLIGQPSALDLLLRAFLL